MAPITHNFLYNLCFLIRAENSFFNELEDWKRTDVCPNAKTYADLITRMRPDGPNTRSESGCGPGLPERMKFKIAGTYIVYYELLLPQNEKPSGTPTTLCWSHFKGNHPVDLVGETELIVQSEKTCIIGSAQMSGHFVCSPSSHFEKNGSLDFVVCKVRCHCDAYKESLVQNSDKLDLLK